jgi:branched-chain amino acid transport system substrate-binding protein
MNNKKLSILISITIIIVVGVTILQNRMSQANNVIKIGYIAPLSGNLAFMGEGIRNAALLKLEELEMKKTKYKYELIFEDDGFDPKRTASAVNKLVSIDQVDAIVTVASAAGGVANPLAENAQVVHFGIASDPNIAKGQYNFINWTPPVEQIKLFIAEAESRGIKRLAIFGQNISGITAVIDELKKQIISTDITIVSEDVSNFGTKDFRSALTKAKVANPDYFVFIMFSPELEIATNQMKDLAIKTPLTAIESFELSDNPSLFEGLWYVNAADPTKEFSTAYESKYRKNPTIATPNSYDILGLISNAAEMSVEKPNATELANLLEETTNYSGALGNNLSINSAGLVMSKATVRMIKDGKPVTISN